MSNNFAAGMIAKLFCHCKWYFSFCQPLTLAALHQEVQELWNSVLKDTLFHRPCTCWYNSTVLIYIRCIIIRSDYCLCHSLLRICARINLKMWLFTVILLYYGSVSSRVNRSIITPVHKKYSQSINIMIFSTIASSKIKMGYYEFNDHVNFILLEFRIIYICWQI